MLFKGPQSSPGSVIRDGDTVALKTVRGYWWYVSGIYVIASRNNGDARPYSIFKTTPPDPAKPETLDSIIRHDDLIRLKNLAIWHWGRGDEWVEVAPQHQSFIAAYNAFAGPSKMPSPKPRRSARG